MKILIILLVGILGISLVSQVYAVKVIGIVVETSALKTGKISYSELIPYDNSNRKISGDFIKKDDDITRKCTGVKNNLSYYSFKKNHTIIIDPCMTQSTHIPLINIVSKLDEFHGIGQKSVKEFKPNNDTKAITMDRFWSSTRYVNDKCDNAIITSKDWPRILNDTISYLTHECDPKFTTLNTTSKESIKLTKHDITSSYKYKLQKWQDQIKQCSKVKNGCKAIEQPTRGGYESKIPGAVILNKTRAVN